MADFTQYIGIPYKWASYDPADGGLFCYSLVKWVLDREYGISIPKLPHKGARQMDESDVVGPKYRQVPFGKTKAGDVVRLRCIAGRRMVDNHVGIYAGPNHVLHLDRTTAVIEDSRREEFSWRLIEAKRLEQLDSPCM